MITSSSVSNRYNYRKENSLIRSDYTDNLKQRNGKYHETVRSLVESGLLVEGVSQIS